VPGIIKTSVSLNQLNTTREFASTMKLDTVRIMASHLMLLCAHTCMKHYDEALITRILPATFFHWLLPGSGERVERVYFMSHYTMVCFLSAWFPQLYLMAVALINKNSWFPCVVVSGGQPVWAFHNN